MSAEQLAASPEITARSNRFYVIDLLRGIFSILVIAGHVFSSSVFVLGAQGMIVDFFFVVSGFVLEPSYPKSARDIKKARKFVVRRMVRLWPLTITALLLALLVYAIEPQATQFYGTSTNNFWFTYLSACLLLQVFVQSSYYWIGTLWSSSSMWFANLIAIPVLDNRKNWKLLATIAGSWLVMLYFFWSADQAGVYPTPSTGYLALIRTIFGFCIGLYLRSNFEKLRNINWLVSPATAASALILLFASEYLEPVLITLVAAPIISVCVLFFAHREAQLRNYISPNFASFAGRISFGVYLLHPIFIALFSYIIKSQSSVEADSHPPAVTLQQWIVYLLTVICSVTLASMISNRIENPIQRRYSAWAKSRPQ